MRDLKNVKTGKYAYLEKTHFKFLKIYFNNSKLYKHLRNLNFLLKLFYFPFYKNKIKKF